MTEFTKLFEPGYIGKLQVKNRIIQAPMSTRFAADDGSVTPRLLNYYKERAKGGTGLIIVEFSYIDNKASQTAYNELGIYDDSLIPGLSTLAKEIKDSGARAGIQICHAGRQRFLGKYPILAPSQMSSEKLDDLVAAEITTEEITGVIDAFGNAARIAQQSGFDMVEIHGAHGYLITQFLSSLTNKREDNYGGSLRNRMRFALEVVSSVKKYVSGDFAVGIRIIGSEYTQGGITIAEAQQFALELEKAGIDVIHVSGGTRDRVSAPVPMLRPLAFNVPLAEAIKKVVQTPVIASGSITSPQLAEHILKKGKVDFISLARPLLADPWYARKAAEGKSEDIVPCIRCNECLHRGPRSSKPVSCAVNISAGREGEFDITPAPRSKVIAVIGGGPGGMEAARVAALRGHSVTLYEKTERLGGRLSKVSKFIPDIAILIDYLSTQLDKLGVKVILGKEATTQTLQKQTPDTIILATGRTSLIPDIQGADRQEVMTIDELMEGKHIGNNVVIVGGDFVGCEIAFFLALAGKLYGLRKYDGILPGGWAKRVNRWLLTQPKMPAFLRKKIIIIEASDTIAYDVEQKSKQVIEEVFAKYGVQLNPGLKLEEVLNGGIIAVDNHKLEHFIKADTVIFTGSKSDSGLLEEFQTMNIPIHPIGDYVEPRRIYDAIHEGFLAAYKL